MASEGSGGDGFARVASAGLLLLIWSVTAWRVDDPTLLPGPFEVAGTAWRLARQGDLLHDTAATLSRVAAAFTIAMLAGTALGYASGRSRRFDAWADPWLVVALNLPLLVVVVLVYIWVGLNERAAVLAVVIAKVPSIAVTIREGARSLDPALDDVAFAFAVPRLRRLVALIGPQLAPYLAAAARSGLSITWKIVLVVELLGRPDGVGFALNVYFQNFDTRGVLAYGLVFAALMLVIETLLLRPLERRAGAWHARA